MHPRVVAEDAGQGDFATGNVEPVHFVPGLGPTVLLVQCRSNLCKQKEKKDLKRDKINNTQDCSLKIETKGSLFKINLEEMKKKGDTILGKTVKEKCVVT
jgi:hypothetical protein